MNSLGLLYPRNDEADLLHYFTHVANAMINHAHVE